MNITTWTLIRSTGVFVAAIRLVKVAWLGVPFVSQPVAAFLHEVINLIQTGPNFNNGV
jgi:hypothetical protein